MKTVGSDPVLLYDASAKADDSVRVTNLDTAYPVYLGRDADVKDWNPDNVLVPRGKPGFSSAILNGSRDVWASTRDQAAVSVEVAES